MATATEKRTERPETEIRFWFWIRFQRFVESLSNDGLDTLAATGGYLDRPEPPPGRSPLNNMTPAELLKLWQKKEKVWLGRNRKEMKYFALHGHWPEQAYSAECQRKRHESGIR